MWSTKKSKFIYWTSILPSFTLLAQCSQLLPKSTWINIISVFRKLINDKLVTHLQWFAFSLISRICSGLPSLLIISSEMWLIELLGFKHLWCCWAVVFDITRGVFRAVLNIYDGAVSRKLLTSLTHFQFPTYPPILNPLKTPENPCFSGIFRGYKMGTSARDGLKAFDRFGHVGLLPKLKFYDIFLEDVFSCFVFSEW